jgi:hypothetical protein
MAAHRKTQAPPAAAAATITLGGVLPVNRMGFGTMRLTGPGVWGPPKDRAEAIRVRQRAVELGVDSSIRPTRTGRTSRRKLSPRRCIPTPEGC